MLTSTTRAFGSPSRYIQGYGELERLQDYTADYGKKVLAIIDPFFYDTLSPSLKEAFEAAGSALESVKFGGETTITELERLAAIASQNGSDVIVGIGGGKTIDAAKYTGIAVSAAIVIAPTSAATDAPTSALSVTYTEEGVHAETIYFKRNPDLILVDSKIVSKAPIRLLVSGMGDALSTWFEARACKNSGARTMARGNVSNTGLMMARLCYDLLMEKGRDALAAVERHEVTPALEDVVEATIYLSGLGFENGGLAAAHAVNDGFAQEPQAHGMYHGEKVAFGTLVQLVLEKAPQEELEQVLAFLRDTGLPLTLAQLGVKEIVPETLKKVAEAAVVPTQSTKNLRADITAQEVYDAILEADRIGRDYLAR